MTNPFSLAQRWIDRFLNGITMYRLTLYGLLVLAGIAIGLSIPDLIFYTPTQLLISLSIFAIGCRLSNAIISRLLRAPTNHESAAITSVILFFILPPAQSWPDVGILLLAAIIAMASKYIFAFRKKHLFNPAAFAGVAITYLTPMDVSWWVMHPLMIPAVAILGFLIVRKLRRFGMFSIFFATALITGAYFNFQYYDSFILFFQQFIVSWPVLFMGTVMFTEPLTTPPTARLRTIYAVLVGFLFGSPLHLGIVHVTPELALLLGNIYSFAVSSKTRLILHLKEKREIAKNTYEFLFHSDQRLSFSPGQYLEWTLPHATPDARGNRRFFTVASSPTEADIKLGIRFSEAQGSSFKKKLLSLTPQESISAGQLAGDFVLPTDTSQKLAFIAGGIGVTPFRSMIQYLSDRHERRDIVLLYSNKSEPEIAYRNLFDAAASSIGLKPIYILSGPDPIPPTWQGKTGFITPAMIQETIPDFRERIFYLSGPHAMVESYKQMLMGMHVPRRRIRTDYFPGF